MRHGKNNKIYDLLKFIFYKLSGLNTSDMVVVYRNSLLARYEYYKGYLEKNDANSALLTKIDKLLSEE